MKINKNDEYGQNIIRVGSACLRAGEDQHTNLAASVLDVELEDTLDLLDLLLTLGIGKGLEVLVDLDEDGRGLETINSESYKPIDFVGRMRMVQLDQRNTLE